MRGVELTVTLTRGRLSVSSLLTVTRLGRPLRGGRLLEREEVTVLLAGGVDGVVRVEAGGFFVGRKVE